MNRKYLAQCLVHCYLKQYWLYDEDGLKQSKYKKPDGGGNLDHIFSSMYLNGELELTESSKEFCIFWIYLLGPLIVLSSLPLFSLQLINKPEGT